MSQLLALLNRLKVEARSELLTDNQQLAWKEIRRLLQFPERVNLSGECGGGKTFLGWALARTLDVVLFTTPMALHQSDFFNKRECLVVVDNATSELGDLRWLLAELQMRNGRSTLIITRKPNQIGLPLIHLPLPTPQDIAIVYRNLSLLERYALRPRTEGDLWQIIYSTLL